MENTLMNLLLIITIIHFIKHGDWIRYIISENPVIEINKSAKLTKRKQTVHDRKLHLVLLIEFFIKLEYTTNSQLKWMLKIHGSNGFQLPVRAYVYPLGFDVYDRRRMTNPQLNPMVFEGNRFGTFRLNRIEYDAFLTVLARVGFYYDDTTGHTKCAFCGVHYTNGSIPANIHLHNCPYDTDENIPFVVPERQQVTSTHEPETLPRFCMYNTVEKRALTFSRQWTSDVGHHFARTGFFFTGHDDIVQCVYCGGCLKGWSRCTRQMESPYIQHIVNFPDCPFVRYHHNDEIELFSNLGLRFIVDVHTGDLQDPDFVNQSTQSQTSCISSIPTCSTVSSTISRTPRSPIRRLAFHNVQSTEQIDPESPFAQHSSKRGTADPLGRHCELPEYPRYSTSSARLRSYNNWPGYLNGLPNQLASAGFFMQVFNHEQCHPYDTMEVQESSTKTGSQLTNRNMSSTDSSSSSPSLENHFVPLDNSNIRHPFVAQAEATDTGLNYSGHDGEHPVHSTQRNLNNRLDSFRHWSSNNSQNRRLLAQAGFFFTGRNDYVRCFHCDIGLSEWTSDDDPWTEHARHSPRCRYLLERRGQNFIESVQTEWKKHYNPRHHKYKDYKSRLLTFGSLNITIKSTPQRLAQAGFFYTGDDDIVRCFCCDGGLRLQQLEAGSDLWEEHVQCCPKCQYLVTQKGNVFVKSIQENIKKTDTEYTDQDNNPVDNSTNQETEWLSHLVYISRMSKPRNYKKLKIENKRLKEQLLCKVCQEQNRCITFLPCGHFICCLDCGYDLKDRSCPVCCQTITEVISTYLSCSL